MKVMMIGAGNPAPTFIQRQVEALHHLNIEVTFLPDFASHAYLNTFLCKHGITVFLDRKTAALIRQADILHYQWPGHWLAFHTLAQKFHKKSVLSLRGRQINILPYLPGKENYVRELHRWLPRCDAFHCVSRDILSQAVGFGAAAERARVIYTAVDTQWFTPAPIAPPSPPLQVLMVGALIWRKGYEYALLAFKKVIERPIAAHLTIVGQGDEHDRLQYTIGDLGLGENVTLTGAVPGERVRDFMQRSHVFLHTSLSEGIANGVVEAMACGLPVVCAACGGMVEVICDGREGFLAPARDPDATAEALIRLAESPDLRMQMGAEARQRAVQMFSIDQQGSQFASLYQEVLSGSAPTGVPVGR